MSSHKEGLEILYLTVLLFGVLGNLFLLYLHCLKFITGQRKKYINLITINLALTHTLMIIFRGIPIIMDLWGWKSFLDDMIGKILSYLIRATRGISLCSTSLLSVFQAIIISPNNQMWAEMKTRVPKYIVPCSLCCWIFNILIDVIVSVVTIDPKNNSTGRWRLGHSSFNLHAAFSMKILIWKSAVDALFMGLMLCSSGYMVSVLYRHKEQVQHIHSISLSPRTSHETKATKAILMLVGSFVCCNAASSPTIIYIVSDKATRYWGFRLTVIFSLIYPIISPFMLINFDTQIRVLHILSGFKKLCQNSLVNENC
ncbi:vomeronasal type-1 receptor 1-like [Macrotis lagotis]|uniref:vomeronasal type-1 receptor 1-like n=1 Tax=Macrotis lagotis TaxID=92651 RepID=UPI003D6805D9